MDFISIFKQAEENRIDFKNSVRKDLIEALEEIEFEKKILEASKKGMFYITIPFKDNLNSKLVKMLSSCTMVPYYCKEIAKENNFKIEKFSESVIINFGNKNEHD